MEKRNVVVENEEKKDFLWSYRNQKDKAERIKEQRDELRENKVSISIINDGMPHGTNKSDLSDYAAQFDELDQEYRRERYKSVRKFLLVRRSIEELTKDKEKAVLTYRYLRGDDWDKVAKKIGYCLQWTHKLHSRALKNLKIPKEAIESDSDSML